MNIVRLEEIHHMPLIHLRNWLAHTLNLCVHDAIQANQPFSNLLKKCRALVAHFKHSVAAARKLKSTQINMGFPVLKVKQDVATRWNSALIMMERLQEIKSALSVTVTDLPQAPQFLNASDWEILTDCVKVLKPLETMTKELSGEKYPTMALIIPLIRGLQHKIKNLRPQTDIGANLQRGIMEIISRRLGILETNRIIVKATFLGPKGLKKTAFGLDENGRNAQKWVTDEVTNIINNNNNPSSSTVTSDEPSSDPKDDQDSLWIFFEEKVAQVQTTITPGTSGTLLVRQYMELPRLKRQNDPLEFWNLHKNILPELYQLHLKYSCIPATSVPSERLFSKAGQLTNMCRNRLLPKNLDQIIFLNSYLF
ncbi:hypothetical protein NQ315_014430 [Exocentrus adspersus]|uniref:HAT C-terminal dimerisation domain-containing protein n=1 Tax=Exocentrus adspersus TaxID=1586481 RepID=A0AAV8VBG5_9CUCU|nr:hypothetical protein NQ315_014430 [Exocentrus adspersus]